MVVRLPTPRWGTGGSRGSKQTPPRPHEGPCQGRGGSRTQQKEAPHRPQSQPSWSEGPLCMERVHPQAQCTKTPTWRHLFLSRVISSTPPAPVAPPLLPTPLPPSQFLLPPHAARPFPTCLSTCLCLGAHCMCPLPPQASSPHHCRLSAPLPPPRQGGRGCPSLLSKPSILVSEVLLSTPPPHPSPN